MRVHLLHTPRPEHLSLLQARLNPAVVLSEGDAVPPDTQVLVAGRPSVAQIEAAPALESLLIPFAGLPAVTRALMRAYPQIAVHNLHHNAPMTAEMALALMFAAARTLIPADRVFRRHDWTPRYESHQPPYTGVILEGKTALILGYGAVGRRVGAVCAALGMQVIATRRRHVPQADPVAELHPPDALHALLPRAQLLFICLPGTDATDGLIGARELALLPPGAVLVNVGRAAVIDPAALFAALRDGHLHSAGLDVWYHYPADVESRTHTAPADYPFETLDNVVLSPHRAGGGGIPEVETRRMAALAESLNQAAAGAGLPHRVDLDAGY